MESFSSVIILSFFSSGIYKNNLRVYQAAGFHVHDVKSGRLQMLQLLLGDDDAQVGAGLPQPDHLKVLGRGYFGHSHRFLGRDGFDVVVIVIIDGGGRRVGVVGVLI